MHHQTQWRPLRGSKWQFVGTGCGAGKHNHNHTMPHMGTQHTTHLHTTLHTYTHTYTPHYTHTYTPHYTHLHTTLHTPTHHTTHTPHLHTTHMRTYTACTHTHTTPHINAHLHKLLGRRQHLLKVVTLIHLWFRGEAKVALEGGHEGWQSQVILF